MDASAFEERLREETAYAERVLREHLPKEEGMQGKRCKKEAVGGGVNMSKIQ